MKISVVLPTHLKRHLTMTLPHLPLSSKHQHAREVRREATMPINVNPVLQSAPV
jgi:hypothetical protein